MATHEKKTQLPTHYARDYIAAIVVVGLFYTVICFALRIESDDDRASEVTRKRADIVFIDEKEFGPRKHHNIWLKDLLAWRDVLDPKLLFMPNQEYGFSRIRNTDFQRPFSHFDRRSIEIELDEPQALQPTSMSPAVTALRLERERARRHLAPTVDDIAEPSPIPDDIVWTNADNRPEPRLPPLQLPPELADETFTTTGPTQIVVLPMGPLFPDAEHSRMGDYSEGLKSSGQRFTVLRAGSCGVKVLDDLALAHIRQLFNAKANRQRMRETAPEWLEEKARFVCHWRFLPNVTENPDPKDREGWHDRDWN
ncbi:MAG: hypothetical protein QGF67_13365 [Lentisphaeria bacterium]|jgi:hypothetical protein|nr:hypothetical protein [Lentisphaeria bacterium]MDP7742425.1 hypothetical protein [Lentisphaeria bacterium]